VRKALGRIALLLGIVVVGAMAWYGASSLFEDEGSDDESTGDVECVAAATRSGAREAQQAFVRKYGDAEWFGDADVKRGEGGFVLEVTYRKDRQPPALPRCQSEVVVVAVRGRARAD
jgi:hypothetical protein